MKFYDFIFLVQKRTQGGWAEGKTFPRLLVLFKISFNINLTDKIEILPIFPQ